MPAPAPAPPEVEPARGVALTLAAKGLFILSGLAIQLVVPRLLGTTGYGELATATAALAILTNTMTTTLVQTTSQRVSTADPGERAAVERGALRAAAILGVVLGAAFSLVSVPVAGSLLHDAALAPLLSMGGLVIAAYALYSASIGVLNGRRTFREQARLDATFSTVRALGQIGGAAIGVGALGVMGGFAGAAVALAAIGVLSARTTWGPAASLGPFFRTLLPLAVLQLALNAVLQLDVEVLKSEVAMLAIADGASLADAAERASHLVGTYRAAQQLAFLPYQLSIAVTLVLFPVVAHAKKADDDDAARRATEGALRFTLLLLVGMEAPLVAGGAGVVRLLLPAFVEGADALPVLAVGQVAFALFALTASILAGAGALGAATRSAVLGLMAMLGALAAFVWSAGADGPLRIAAAAGSAVGASVALAVALLALRSSLGARFPWPTLVRAGIAGVSAVFVARLVPGEGALPTLARLAIAVAVTFGLLVASRELGAGDLALVQRVLGRGRGAPTGR